MPKPEGMLENEWINTEEGRKELLKGKKPKAAKIDHDKEHGAIAVLFQPDRKFKHRGVSEELNLLGITIVLDRNKNGTVKAMEILY